MAKQEIPEELVDYLRECLSPKGVRFFQLVQEHYGKINAILDTETSMAFHKGEGPPKTKGLVFPHPVHFREGMDVRNAMRRSGHCEGWTDEDLDGSWEEVVERAIAPQKLTPKEWERLYLPQPKQRKE